MSTFTLMVGALVAAGGTAGYIKARSTPSLAAGIGFGTLFAICSYFISSGNPGLGHKLAFLLSLALFVIMGRRYLATQKVMPPGVIAGIGAVSLLYHLSYIL